MGRGAWWPTVHGVVKSWSCPHAHELYLKWLRWYIVMCFSSQLKKKKTAGKKPLNWASLVAQRLKHLPGMRESQVQSLGQEDLLEKEMATHSSTLAWRIPWREEPGRLPSMGSQRVGHWATSLHFTFVKPEFDFILIQPFLQLRAVITLMLQIRGLKPRRTELSYVTQLSSGRVEVQSNGSDIIARGLSTGINKTKDSPNC